MLFRSDLCVLLRTLVSLVADHARLGYKSQLPRLLLEFHFFNTLYSCICISHNMGPLQYGWSNMLPSPILYHAEPASSGLRTEPSEPPATAGPSVASYPFSIPDTRPHDAMEIEPAQAGRPPLIGPQRQATNSRRRFRNQDWEEHRDTLHQLYMVEDKSLPAVMEHMQ